MYLIPMTTIWNAQIKKLCRNKNFFANIYLSLLPIFFYKMRQLNFSFYDVWRTNPLNKYTTSSLTILSLPGIIPRLKNIKEKKVYYLNKPTITNHKLFWQQFQHQFITLLSFSTATVVQVFLIPKCWQKIIDLNKLIGQKGDSLSYFRSINLVQTRWLKWILPTVWH